MNINGHSSGRWPLLIIYSHDVYKMSKSDILSLLDLGFTSRIEGNFVGHNESSDDNESSRNGMPAIPPRLPIFRL